MTGDGLIHKKLLAGLLCAALLAGLAGCGSGGAPTSAGTDPGQNPAVAQTITGVPKTSNPDGIYVNSTGGFARSFDEAWDRAMGGNSYALVYSSAVGLEPQQLWSKQDVLGGNPIQYVISIPELPAEILSAAKAAGYSCLMRHYSVDWGNGRTPTTTWIFFYDTQMLWVLDGRYGRTLDGGKYATNSDGPPFSATGRIFSVCVDDWNTETLFAIEGASIASNRELYTNADGNSLTTPAVFTPSPGLMQAIVSALSS